MSEQQPHVIGGDGQFHVEDEAVDISIYGWEDWVTFALFWIMAAVVFYQVYTRYVLSDSAGWTEEIARYFLVAVVFIVAPWLFGFSDVDSATVISIAVGVVMLVSESLTRWRYSLAKLIPLRTHFGTDLALGALLILSPFIFGFSDEGGATRFMIIFGAIELVTALSTRWDPAEAEAGDTRRRSGTRTARA